MENRQLNHIIKRFLEGLYINKDIKNLKDALNTKSGYEEVSKAMDDVWNDISNTQQTPASLDNYALEAKGMLEKTKLTVGKSRLRLKILQTMRYAAFIILVVLSGFAIKEVYSRIEQANITYIEVIAADKERKEIILPDGSTVVLNACSSLRYPDKFITQNRVVEIKGEAFFEVSKDKSHPFIVHTDEGMVKVLGTSFDVKAYKEDKLFSVSVKTGKVEVKMEESLMRLLPNECLIYNKENGEITKRKDNVERVTSWMQGGLYFNDTPIQSIILELERMYGCVIELDSNCVFDETLFGEHDNQSLDAVLKSIEYSTGIKSKKENERIVLYK